MNDKMASPVFSIVIPTFNRAEEVLKAVESVLNQTFTDWQLVIVDDGSTDDTLARLSALSDTRVRIFSIAHCERSAARNFGMQQCTGTYICFLDSDDLFLANHLATLEKAILSQPEMHVFRTGAWLSTPALNAVRCLMEKTDDSEPFPFECIQTFAFHRQTIQDITFDSRFSVGEDLHFLLQVGLRSEICSISDWTVVYHNRAPVTDKQKLVQYYKQKLYCIDDILLWNHHLILAYLHRHRSLASLHMMKLCRTNPTHIILSTFLVLQSFLRYPGSFLAVLGQLFQRFKVRAM